MMGTVVEAATYFLFFTSQWLLIIKEICRLRELDDLLRAFTIDYAKLIFS
jgi:hypothetical protein